MPSAKEARNTGLSGAARDPVCVAPTYRTAHPRACLRARQSPLPVPPAQRDPHPPEWRAPATAATRVYRRPEPRCKSGSSRLLLLDLTYAVLLCFVYTTISETGLIKLVMPDISAPYRNGCYHCAESSRTAGIYG